MPTDSIIIPYRVENSRVETCKWVATIFAAAGMLVVGTINPSKWSLEKNVGNKVDATLAAGCPVDSLIEQSVPYTHWAFNMLPVPAWAEMHVYLRRNGSRDVMAVPADDTDKIYQTNVPKSRLPRQITNPTCGAGSP